METKRCRQGCIADLDDILVGSLRLGQISYLRRLIRTIVPDVEWSHPGPRYRATLLVVDDRGEIREALRRFFSLTIAEVVVAGTPDDAERMLRSRKPSLLLCDYYLGHHQPPATSLISRWRQEFPFLQRVAIVTGTRGSSLGPCPGADAVFEKPLNMREVTDVLVGLDSG